LPITPLPFPMLSLFFLISAIPRLGDCCRCLLALPAFSPTSSSTI
jgi:hypothetical protein